MSLLTGAALAQSPRTLEAVRLFKPNALELAKADLAACLSPPADGGASSCERARELSLLVGYLTLSEGDAKAAAEQLSSQHAPEQLEAFYAYYLGQAYFYSGRPDEAAKQFAAALESSPRWMRSRVRARLGEAYLSAGDPVQAAPLLERAAIERGDAELYWQRSQARRAVGNVDGEKADLRTLALSFPAHPYGALALEKLGPKVTFTFEERLTRARGLLAAGEAQGALDELELVERANLARGQSARSTLALVRAQAYFALGDDSRGEHQLSLAARGQPSVAAEALMLRARRAMRANDNDKARKLFAQVDARFPKESPADDAAYFAAWLDLQAGRYAEAVKGFDAFEKKHARSRRRDEALWFKSLALIRQERYGDAITQLTRLCHEFPRSSLVPQARYWMARSRQLASKSTDGGPHVAEYERLISEFPGSFYALLSAERLRESGKEPPPFFPKPPVELKVRVPEKLSLALALARAGLFRDASDEVKAQIGSVRNTSEAIAFGHALLSLGEAHALAARLLWAAAYSEKDPEALALMYPRAYRSDVEQYAREHALDPFLVWAVMRRESAFRPEVASAADARGLMQVIPPTAEAIARQLAIEVRSPAELFSPDLNLKLGSWYLSALLKRFQHPALSAAAYNAGPKPVARWAKEKKSLPLDLWVEEIPFRETRGYVKQVVADYFIYRRLYGGGEAPLPLTVPEPGDGVDF